MKSTVSETTKRSPMAKFLMTDEGKSVVTAVRRRLFVLPSTASGSIYFVMIQYLESRSAAAIEIDQHLFGSESVSCVLRPAVRGFRVYPDRTAGKSTRKVDEITKSQRYATHPSPRHLFATESSRGERKGERGAKVHLDY